MRLASSLFALSLASQTCLAGAQTSTDTPPREPAGHSIDVATAAEAFTQAEGLAGEDGGRLWGTELSGPMVFVDPETRSAVTNRPDPDRRFEGLDGIWVGTLPPEIGCANTAVDWSGERWTMLLWPLPEEPGPRGVLMVHEMFHRIQPAIDLPMRDAVADHLATRDGRYWLRLEWRALRAALSSTGDARRQAVEDALSFRHRRRTRFPEADESENALELNEGLAEYTGVRLGLPDPEGAERTIRSLRRRDEEIDSISPVRGFAYASGPAYGLLLDRADPGWRSRVAEVGDLGALLGRAMEIEASDLEHGEDRTERYGGPELAAEEDAREAERVARQRSLREKFLEGPRLLLPVAGDFSYGFDPDAAEALPGAGTVYASATVSDSWGSLVVEGGGVLLERRDRGIVGVVVGAPDASAEPPLHGEGWTLTLADGWSLEPGEREGDWSVRREATE